MQIFHLLRETSVQVQGIPYRGEGGIDFRKRVVVNEDAILGANFRQQNGDIEDEGFGEFSQDILRPNDASELPLVE